MQDPIRAALARISPAASRPSRHAEAVRPRLSRAIEGPRRFVDETRGSARVRPSFDLHRLVLEEHGHDEEVLDLLARSFGEICDVVHVGVARAAFASGGAR
jgi:hypothetical protein